MRDYTTKDKAKITAGAISAVVIVGLLAVIALGFLWTPPPKESGRQLRWPFLIVSLTMPERLEAYPQTSSSRH